MAGSATPAKYGGCTPFGTWARTFQFSIEITGQFLRFFF
jgi:hypothetical protein